MKNGKIGGGITLDEYINIRQQGAKNVDVVVKSEAKFGTAVTNDYRATFFAEHPELEGKVFVHHGVEQQVQLRYPGLVSDAELNSLENLRGIPNKLKNFLHLSDIRKAWNQFYRTTPNPTQQQLLDQATKIDNRFGSQFLPPVR